MPNLREFFADAFEGSTGAFFDVFYEYVQYFARSLLKDALPPASEVVWCSDLSTAMDEIAALSFELHEWKVVFLSVEPMDRESSYALSITSVNGHSWTTRLMPWNVVVSLRDEFRELFFSQEFLKIVRTEDCENRLVMDISGIICVIRARALVALNIWEYEQRDPTISDQDDDVTALDKVVRVYVSEFCANEMRSLSLHPTWFDAPDSAASWYVARRAALLPLLFFHGVATCHTLLIGPTPLSDDLDQLLPAAADYSILQGECQTHGCRPLGIWTRMISCELTG